MSNDISDAPMMSDFSKKSDISYSSQRIRVLWVIVALLLVAFTLRVVDLQRRPLHFDEGINVTFGHLSPADILNVSRATFDNDPPGHRMALGVWMALAGPGDFSIRFFSVFFGVLLVAATYRTLRTLRASSGLALTTSALIAVAAYALDYSQQAKGYAMGAALAAISWWMWVSLWRFDTRVSTRTSTRTSTGRTRRTHTGLVLAVYVLSTSLALSTHYYVAFLLPMQWLWAVGTQWNVITSGMYNAWMMLRQRLVAGILGQALACLPLGVWVLLMLQNLQLSTVRSSSRFQPVLPTTLVARILGEMGVSQFADAPTALVAAGLLALAVLVGAWRLWRAETRTSAPAFTSTHAPVTAPVQRRDNFWFGATFAVPVLIAVILQQRLTFFFPRFLLYGLPNLAILITACVWPVAPAGAGLIRRITSVLRWIPAFVCAGVLAIGATAFYRAPIDTANDYRPLVTSMRPLIKSGDAALGTYIWMQGMFISYAPETSHLLRWYNESYSPDSIDALMMPIAKDNARIWSLNFARNPDAPDTLSVLWLKENTAYVSRLQAGTMSALLFDVPDVGGPPVTVARPLSATFGDSIHMDGEFISTSLTPGESVVVTLIWSALRPLSEHYSIFLHLATSDGKLVAQNDGDALNGLAPDFTWDVGKVITDRRAMLIDPALQPGDYLLLAGLYRSSDGVRLVLDDGADSVQIGTLHVRNMP